MIKHQWIVVGAGFTGATVARRLADRGAGPVLVIDRRSHIAGNAFDERNDRGLRIHRYGPHIFHTNSRKIWTFLSAFTDWRPYEHRVIADIGQMRLPLPFNMKAVRIAFGEAGARRIADHLQAAYQPGQDVSLFSLLSAGQTEVANLGKFIYDNIFLNYSLKQWGMRPEKLAPSVIGRVPFRFSEDDRYFRDRFQAMPSAGYATLVARMLDHPSIRIELNVSHQDLPPEAASQRTVFTGSIDEYFGYLHGALDYRSVRFETETLEVPRCQPVGTVNYPNVEALTRITEFKHLTGEDSPVTTIMKEYPRPHRNGVTEPYYPVATESNSNIYDKYRKEAAKLSGKVWFAGRLGSYTYYNMDQAVGCGLALVDKELLPCSI